MLNITKSELQEKVDNWVAGEGETLHSDQILWVLDVQGWTLDDNCQVVEKRE